MNVEAVSNIMSAKAGVANNISSIGAVNANLLSQKAPQDSVNFKGRSAEMSDAEKQELILKARTKAAGYAFWGGIISALYYGLRSDEKVAQKYNLDPVEDKDLVKKIKKEQLMWTLPAAVTDILVFGGAMLGGISLLVGGGAYLYNKCIAEPKDVKLQ